MLHVGDPFVHVHKRGDIKLLEHSDSYIVHYVNNYRSLVIEYIDIWKLPLCEVLLRCCRY